MGGGCEDFDDPLFLQFLRSYTPHLGWLLAELALPLGSSLRGLRCLWTVSSIRPRISRAYGAPTWEPLRVHGLHRNCALFWPPEITRVRQPLLVLSSFFGYPRERRCCVANSPIFLVPERVGVRQPLLLVSPFSGKPKNVGVTQQFRHFFLASRLLVRIPCSHLKLVWLMRGMFLEMPSWP